MVQDGLDQYNNQLIHSLFWSKGIKAMQGREDRNRQETQRGGQHIMLSSLLSPVPAALVACQHPWGVVGLPAKHCEGKVRLLHHARRSFRVSVISAALVVNNAAGRSGTNWARQPAQSKPGFAQTHARLVQIQSNPTQFHTSPIP